MATYLASGQIQANDLGWYQGAPRWMPINELLALIEQSQNKEILPSKKISPILPLVLISSVVILIAVAVMSALFISRNLPATNQSSASNVQESNVQLRATAECTMAGLIITNNDNFPYSNPELIIHNGGVFSGGYWAHSRDIAAHKSITIPWSAFTMTDGTRFNYFSEKPTMITMEVGTNNGKGITGWKF